VLWANAGGSSLVCNEGEVSSSTKYPTHVLPGVSDNGPALTQPIADYERNFRVNALGPVVLFQSFYDLLSKSNKAEKKFIITSTALGSQAMAGSGPFAAYGMSKVAANHFGLKVHKEHGEQDKLVVLLVHPGKCNGSKRSLAVKDYVAEPTCLAPRFLSRFLGLVATDMTAGLSFKPGDEIDFDGVTIPVITPEHSAESMKKLVTEATYETHGGKFLAYDGSSIPW